MKAKIIATLVEDLTAFCRFAQPDLRNTQCRYVDPY